MKLNCYKYSSRLVDLEDLVGDILSWFPHVRVSRMIILACERNFNNSGQIILQSIQDVSVYIQFTIASIDIDSMTDE